ncbi:MAG: HupE/UreJ family protein [Myxococcota bacterium]
MRAASRATGAMAFFLLLLLGLVGASPAMAHPLQFAVLRLVEVAPGEFAARYRVSGGENGAESDILVPSECTLDGAPVMSPIPFGFEARYSLHCSDVPTAVSGEFPTYLEVKRSPTESPSVLAYGALGFRHVAEGWDHLLFLLGLLLLVGANQWRRLVGTVTAFTVGHSVTLALATVGVLQVSPGVTEAVIALSIVLVAREALVPASEGKSASLSHRRPWSVALLFGLVHGLGFAGALYDLALPSSDLPLALLGFNLGVEAAQLVAIGLALAIAAVYRRVADGEISKRWFAYPAGTAGAYLFFRHLAPLL